MGAASKTLATCRGFRMLQESASRAPIWIGCYRQVNGFMPICPKCQKNKNSSQQRFTLSALTSKLILRILELPYTDKPKKCLYIRVFGCFFFCIISVRVYKYLILFKKVKLSALHRPFGGLHRLWFGPHRGVFDLHHLSCELRGPLNHDPNCGRWRARMAPPESYLFLNRRELFGDEFACGAGLEVFGGEALFVDDLRDDGVLDLEGLAGGVDVANLKP
jgi:hypothetical protein